MQLWYLIKNMQPVHTSPLEPELGPTRGSATTDYVLHVTMLYPDLMTREWAPELGRQRVQPVRRDSVRAVGGRIQEMTRPEACLGATPRSVPAEVMVVAVSAADTSPRAPLQARPDPGQGGGGGATTRGSLANGVFFHSSGDRQTVGSRACFNQRWGVAGRSPRFSLVSNEST